MRNIVQLGNDILRVKTPYVDAITDDIKSNVKKMNILLRLSQGYGLAAPQVGLSQRFFVYNVGKGFKTIINPEIVEHSSEMVTMDEGCLSIKGYSFQIERPREVYLRGMDLAGEGVAQEVDGLVARLFQHELDHLNGVLVIDHLPAEYKENFLSKWSKRKRK